jgi:hypothetical protein
MFPWGAILGVITGSEICTLAGIIFQYVGLIIYFATAD